MEKTAICWPPAILGHPRGHTNSKGTQVSTPVNHCGPSSPVKSLPFMAQRPASSAEQANQVPLPGYQCWCHVGTHLQHLPTPSPSRFLASQIGNRHRSNKENHTGTSHLLTPTLARPRKTCGLHSGPLGHSETRTKLIDPTWSSSRPLIIPAPEDPMPPSGFCRHCPQVYIPPFYNAHIYT